MPRGGSRVGSGRKPHTRRERWLGGNAGGRNLALVSPPALGAVSEPVAVSADALQCPSVLTPREAAYWELWAPLAQQLGTLHAGRVPGFVLLCQTARKAEMMWASIEERGLEQERVTIDGAGQEHREYKANTLISHWRGLMTRVEQLQARYGLAADGKVPAPVGSLNDEEEALARILAVK